jgi:hypothetical protein
MLNTRHHKLGSCGCVSVLGKKIRVDLVGEIIVYRITPNCSQATITGWSRSVVQAEGAFQEVGSLPKEIANHCKCEEDER